MEIEAEGKVKLRMICFSLLLAHGLLASQLRLTSRHGEPPFDLCFWLLYIKMAHDASYLRFWPALYVCCLSLFCFVATLYHVWLLVSVDSRCGP